MTSRKRCLLLLALWLTGCTEESIAPLGAEYAGCAEVLDGPVCVLAPGSVLRLWVPVAEEDPLEVLTGEGTRMPVQETLAIEGGRRLVLTPPDGTERLMVRTSTSEGRGSWQLALTSHTAPHPSAERAARLDGEGYEALEAGDLRLAAQHLEAARQAWFEAGQILRAAFSTASRVYCHLQERRFTEARKVLESLTPTPEDPAEIHFQSLYYRGVMAGQAGDSRTALERLDQAAHLARRLGLRRELGMSQEVQGLELRKLGRAQEAAAIFARLRAEESYGANLIDQARLLNNHGWTLLLAREAGEAVEDPLPLFEDARKLFERFIDRTDQRANVRLNIALAHLQAGEPQAARQTLDEAITMVEEPPAHLRLWWLDIEARIALGEGRADAALDLYQRLDALAAGAFDPGGRWRAAVGRALAFEASGKRDAALRELATAETLLDEQGLQVPLGEGRETFMAQRGASARLYLELLLDEDRPAQALEVARRSRSRVLRALRYQDRLARLTPMERERWEQAIGEYLRHRTAFEADLEDDWRRSADELARVRQERAASNETLRHTLDRAFTVFSKDTTAPLPPPRVGELLLAYHPLPQGWVGFAALDGQLKVHRFELPPADAPAEILAETLLTPFRQSLEAARTIRILPFGALREIDFHALPLGDEVLLTRAPVVYGLDLPAAPSATVPRRALVVSDPRGDLLAARREAQTVRDTLARAMPQWTVELLEGREAQAQTLGQELSHAGLLHYAGHGVFSGLGGWDSALRLAGESRLTPGDLLALGHSPRYVVLSACDTARAVSPGVESLGLAHSFLLVGAHQVVAAVRPVGDRATEALFRDFYRDWDDAPDLAQRLRRAQLAWRENGEGDWASFRVLEH